MLSNIPHPEINDDSRPFWEGAKNHKLMIQHCDSCGKNIFYPRIICPHCYSDKVSWIEASGKGRIYSYTVVYNAMPAFKSQVPFVIGIIELEEGVRMLSRIAADESQVEIDKPVSVIYEKIDEELTLPYFQLTD